MSRSTCYVISRHDGFWYAVIGGRDLGRFPQQAAAEEFATAMAASRGLDRITVQSAAASALRG
ncbi:hypothetical protein [Caenispirillum bisanense]|uniref:DUF2188 domain-containing protein n=1 Tax=Caenispirillum bisanense TaxID=414052 RepID=A0A286G3N1_9PROT|nr:hypothetical protein [Caenispirillum bisanense]SOD89826.1 hypothetical protein SAMN05421508_101348 [Caenispirillum bisanense]